MTNFDFKNPDYSIVFAERLSRLKHIRENPTMLYALKVYYKDNIHDFINDWGMTFDPRNPERGLPATIPFLLFDRQKEFLIELVESWKSGTPLLVEKSRDMGVSWLCIAAFCSLALFNNSTVFGLGSRKADLADKIGDIGSLLEKARFFLENLPLEFNGGFNRKTCSKEGQLIIPDSKSMIKSEAGDNLGRGDRTSGYCVDEAAHIERAQRIEASLSATTNFRLDVSTPCGMNNVFAEKRFSGRYKVFTFRWQDDPRKDENWYNKKKGELDPVTFAQEIDLDYSSSVDRVLIPSVWVEAAIDAHIKLGFQKTGAKIAGLDLADEGKDKNALLIRHGVVLEYARDFSGKNSDIAYTVERTIDECSRREVQTVHYDAEGLGAGVRGDARLLQERKKTKLTFNAFRSSDKVRNPETKVFDKDLNSIKNKDMFANLKAQTYWELRNRFKKTFRAVVEGEKYDVDELISIPSNLENIHALRAEISQPIYLKNQAGKIVIQKTPDGMKSPNLADALMMCYYSGNVLNIKPELVKRFEQPWQAF